MAFSFIKLSREQDPNKQKDLLVNTDRHMYINLPNTLNSLAAINGFRFFLSQYGIWNPRDKIVRTARPQSFYPSSSSGYIDISFMVRLYDEHCDREEEKNRIIKESNDNHGNGTEYKDFKEKRDKFETWSRPRTDGLQRCSTVPREESREDFSVGIPVVSKSKPKKPVTGGYLNDLLEAANAREDAKKANAKQISVQYLKNPRIDQASSKQSEKTETLEKSAKLLPKKKYDGIREKLHEVKEKLDGVQAKLDKEKEKLYGKKEVPDHQTQRLVNERKQSNDIPNSEQENEATDPKISNQVMSSSEILEEHGIHLSDQSHKSEKNHLKLGLDALKDDDGDDDDDNGDDAAVAASDLSVVKSESETEEDTEIEETVSDSFCDISTPKKSESTESTKPKALKSVTKQTVASKKKPVLKKDGIPLLKNLQESDANSEDSTDGKEEVESDDTVEDESDDIESDDIESDEVVNKKPVKKAVNTVTKKANTGKKKANVGSKKVVNKKSLITEEDADEDDSDSIRNGSRKVIMDALTASTKKSFESQEESEDSDATDDTEAYSESSSDIEVELLPKPKKNTPVQAKKPANKSNANTPAKKAAPKRVAKKPPVKNTAKSKSTVSKAANSRSKTNLNEKPNTQKPKKPKKK